jgi:hypothetical protein
VAKFLTTEELYELIQRELPEDAYPHSGNPADYLSTADSDATARVFATAYENLQSIEANNFPQSADEEAIGKWEVRYFGAVQGGPLTLTERRDRVLQKGRERRTMSPDDLRDIVKGVIGSDKVVEIGEWSCGTGSWMLDVSQLGVQTYLDRGRPGVIGLAGGDLTDALEHAYSYTVRIYAYTPTASELKTIVTLLNKAEPSMSIREIISNLNAADTFGGTA